jgi:DNA-binding response OmpR family regulator
VIVVADIEDNSCIQFIDDLRKATSRSWLIIANKQIDADTLALVHFHGADALIAVPISLSDLVERLKAFQLCSRSLF